MRHSDGSSYVGSSDLLRSRCGDHDRIFHRAVFFERADDLGDSRTLLADRDIDAIKLLAFIIAGVVALLVDEGVDRDCGLAGLAVAVIGRASWRERVCLYV